MKKNILKKVFCAAAILVLVSSALAAAPKKKGKAKKEAKSPYDSVVKATDAKGKVLNFDGMQVILADWWSGQDAESGDPVSPSDADNRAWHKWTQSTYNFGFKQKQLSGGWDSHPQAVSNFCISGGKENYVFVIDGRSALTGLKGNLFYDLSKITSVDFNASKWDKGTKGMITKGDSFYAMRHLAPEPRGGVFFNKRLLQEAGIDPEEPYNLQAAGKWNWEAFEKLVAKCTYDKDNDGLNDTWGMANSSTEFVPLAVASNGSTMIGKDPKTGKFVNNVGTEKTLEALAWCAHMATNYEMPQPEGSEWNWMYPAFLNGQVAFLVDQQYHANKNGTFSDMADDWGFVCFPLGPSGDGVYRTLHNDNMYVIPGCYDADRANKIAKIFDLWTDPTPGYDQSTVWKEEYYPLFRDSRAVDETLQIMRNTPNPRFDTLIPGINFMGDVIWVVYPGYVTPQQAYEDTKNVWQSLLDDANR